MVEAKEKENSATDTLSTLAKQLKTTWIAIFVLLVMLFVTNGIWIYVFQSYDYVSQDGNGQNYFNSRIEGSVYNGTESQSEEER